MEKSLTLLEFLEATGASVSIFDIGRRVSEISRHDFLNFEKLQQAYPYPMQQQAWFALSILNQQNDSDPIIWFIHFSLDEMGHLLPAGRDYFIQRLFEAASVAKTTQDPLIKQQLPENALKDNPHIFKPREDKMAVFHARLAVHLQRPPSRFYQHAQAYFSGQQGWEQWNFIGFQGIADIAERITCDDNEKKLTHAITHLPQQPFEALCQCLENINISASITSALCHRCDQLLSTDQPNISMITLGLRGISLSQSFTLKNTLFIKILNHPIASNPEILGAIAARAWEWLENQENAQLYLSKLAQADQETFNACLSDLLFMPKTRESLLGILRHPDRSDQLALAFSELLKHSS